MKRIILKLSGEALAGEKKTGFDEPTVRKVALQVKELVDDGIQVGIVIGGGNFWRGRTSENIDRTKADQIGMLATIMNCIYVSEIFRSGIQSIDRGQTEAARSLGLSSSQTMLRIILPQAFKNVLPAMCNEFVAVTKETSLASTFYVGDLMTQYQTISGKTYLVIEPLIIIGVIYFVVTFTMSKFIAVLERRLKAGD